MPNKLLKIFGIIILLGLIFIADVEAADSCTATVSPSSVQTSRDTNFSFSVVNTGTETVTAVKITRPSENFNLENYGVSGWSVNSNNTFAELTGGTVNAGATFNFSYHGLSGSSEASSANWTVEANSGSGYMSCTGRSSNSK